MGNYQKPKVIFSNYDDLKNPFYAGGGAVAVHEVAKRLVGDFEMEVLTGKYPGSRDEIIDGVRYHRVGLSSAGPKLGQLVYSLLLPFCVMRTEFDVWVESFTPPVSTGLLSLFTKKPVIGLAHMLSADDMQRKYKLPFHWIENFGLRLYRYFIVTSEMFRDKIRTINSSADIKIIPNGVEARHGVPAVNGMPRHAATRQYDNQYITYLGRIEINQKGLDLLIKAYQLINKQTNQLLLIAGSGTKKEENKLRAMISELELGDKVILAGRVDGNRKAEILSKSIMVVVPSRFETFGMSALEALAYGVPLITFDLEGLKWIPDDTALRVLSQDAKNLSEAMLKVLSDESVRVNLSSKGKQFAENFSWDGIAEKYRRFLSLMLKNNVVQATGLPEEVSDENIISQIVKRRLPCYFISPHLDDAALSAGDLLSYLSGKTDITIITVFTQGTDPPYTLSAKKFLRTHGHKTAKEMYEQRRQEDIAACQKLDAKVIRLGYIDALWRRKPRPGFLSKILPELGNIYPTYRFHVISGKISKEDEGLEKEIIRSLQAVVSKDQEVVVFCPAGFGGHVDHVLVNQACKKAFKNAKSDEAGVKYNRNVGKEEDVDTSYSVNNGIERSRIIYWRDFPYKANSFDIKQFQNYKSSSWHNDFEKKRELIFSYSSQTSVMFPKGNVPDVPEEYYY